MNHFDDVLEILHKKNIKYRANQLAEYISITIFDIPEFSEFVKYAEQNQMAIDKPLLMIYQNLECAQFQIPRGILTDLSGLMSQACFDGVSDKEIIKKGLIGQIFTDGHMSDTAPIDMNTFEQALTIFIHNEKCLFDAMFKSIDDRSDDIFNQFQEAKNDENLKLNDYNQARDKITSLKNNVEMYIGELINQNMEIASIKMMPRELLNQ